MTLIQVVYICMIWWMQVWGKSSHGDEFLYGVSYCFMKKRLKLESEQAKLSLWLTLYISFVICTGEVIKGWDIGVATMKRGEVCVLTCTPEYAYGKRRKLTHLSLSLYKNVSVSLISFTGACTYSLSGKELPKSHTYFIDWFILIWF